VKMQQEEGYVDMPPKVRQFSWESIA
jgi:hypothetical protein